MRGRTAQHRAYAAVLTSIALGGVVGATARHGVSVALPGAPGGWPWATLAVNVTGCALIGAFMVLVFEGWPTHRLLRPFVGVGVLGGYTTFSTYTVDVLGLVDGGRPLGALAYLSATVVGALGAVLLAVVATRALVTSTAPRRGGAS
ncbi:hypothetical protein BH20ACT6_BH20ACT6_11270 [soil metagenome]